MGLATASGGLWTDWSTGGAGEPKRPSSPRGVLGHITGDADVRSDDLGVLCCDVIISDVILGVVQSDVIPCFVASNLSPDFMNSEFISDDISSDVILGVISSDVILGVISSDVILGVISSDVILGVRGLGEIPDISSDVSSGVPKRPGPYGSALLRPASPL